MSDQAAWPEGEFDGDDDDAPELIDLPDGRKFAYFDMYGDLPVVGESFFQDEIKRLASRKGPDGQARFRVALIPEPDNPNDPLAVAIVAVDPVTFPGPIVGYLAKEEASRWSRVLQIAQTIPGRWVMARARTTGGPPYPKYGVAVDLRMSVVAAWFNSIVKRGA